MAAANGLVIDVFLLIWYLLMEVQCYRDSFDVKYQYAIKLCTNKNPINTYSSNEISDKPAMLTEKGTFEIRFIYD